MESTNNSPLTAVSAKGGNSISVVGSTYRLVIGGEQTNGAYALIDMLIPPNGGPGPHSHPTFQEAYYILDGEINEGRNVHRHKRYVSKYTL